MKTVHATLADVAAACGVSRWTVTAILFPSEKNRHVGYSKATRDKVLAAAKRLRYRPNRGSRNLLERKHGVVGVLAVEFFNIPWRAIAAMLSAAKRHGQVLSLESIRNDGDELPVFIRENVVDGLILYESVPRNIEQAIVHHQIPVVYVNTCRHDLPNAINVDEALAMRRAVDYFTQQGKKRVAIIVGSEEALTPHERERVTELHRACKSLRIAAPRIVAIDGNRSAAGRQRNERKLSEILAQPSNCDAVVVPHGAFVWMLHSLCGGIGRRIPDDLAIVSMLDLTRAECFSPSVAAFDLPSARLGTLAIERLNALISGKGDASELLLPYEMKIGQPTRTTRKES